MKEESLKVQKVGSSVENNVLFIQTEVLPIVLSLMVWPGMILLPLVLSSPYSPTSYKQLFPSDWYDVTDSDDKGKEYPKVLGIVLFITGIAFGHVAILTFFYCLRMYTKPIPVQSVGVTHYEFFDAFADHLAQREFVLLGLMYFIVTWTLHWLPKSYYNFHGTIQYDYVFGCLLIQDFIHYILHRSSHTISAEFYKITHKAHHKVINPVLFDAFKANIPEQILLILIPFFCTAHIMRYCNIWTYIAFVSLYGNWFFIIHSEYILPWENSIFSKIKFGTAADHHIHHKFCIYNYGGMFMYWDLMFGTYRSAQSFGPRVFTITTSTK